MATLITRLYTFVDGTTAYGSQVEYEIGNIVSSLNDLNNTTTSWNAASISNGTSTVPLTVSNSTGTQNIVNFKDNTTAVLSIADGGIITATAVATSGTTLTATAANGGTGKALIANNGTSTGNIFEAQDNGTACVTVADGGQVTITKTSDQVVLGTTRTVTLTAPTPASSSRTVTIPDLSANYSVVGTEAAQTVNGVKTLTSAPQVSPSGAGDAYVGVNISGGASWTMGADDSASDAFVISNSATPGTDNAISISTSEVVTIPVQGIVKGTATNDSAAAGYIGEYISASDTGTTSFPTSGQYGDLVNISLTAGDWDVSVVFNAQANGATVTNVQFGVSTTSGNSGAGLTGGSNRANVFLPTATFDSTGSLASMRISLSGTTTYYLKMFAQYSVATPRAQGTLSARRMR